MESSKDILFKALSGFIAITAVVLIYVVFFGPLGIYTGSLVASRTMSVSVSDKVTATPDIAQFSFSVVSEGPDISQITNQNNSKINQAVAMLKNNGIEDKDIETTQYNLYPVYTQVSRGTTGDFVPKIAKYSLTQTVSVKIRDFSKISSVLGALPGLGINQIGSISFSIDDQEVYLSQAREKAFKKAYDKAVAMAQQNGVSIGRIISISDYPQYAYPIYKSTALGMGGVAAPSVAPDIQPGSQDVSVNVTVVYEIK